MKFIMGGRPIAWARPRVNNKIFYDSQLKQKEAYRLLWKMKIKDPLSGPLALICCFVFQTPISKRNVWTQGYPHDKTPDVDNCIKFIMDAGQHVLFNNDSQIVYVQAVKVYGPRAKTLVELIPYNPAIHLIGELREETI